MSAQPHSRISEEEYLRIERAAEFKSEYIDGQMYAMSGASWAHGLITLNFGSELRTGLRDKACAVVANDIRVRITPRRFYTYPDLVVVCGLPAFADNEHDTLLNPTLLVEVLSPSTEKRDRDFKLRHYREIESLKEYVLVSQSEPYVMSYRRSASGEWVLSAWEGVGALCRLESLEIDVRLADIYRQVTFAEEATHGEH